MLFRSIIPIWDLTPFVEGVELSDALDAFSRHGRADDLAMFFKNSQITEVIKLAEPMRQFADDLLLMRIPNLLKDSAPAVQQALSESFDYLKDAYPSVSNDLQDFRDQIDQLAPNGVGPDPVSLDGLKAAAVLADRLWFTRRYAELYGLLRESLLTAFTVVYVAEPHLQPNRLDQKKFADQRAQIEQSWFPLLEKSKFSESCVQKKPRFILTFNTSSIDDARKIAKQIDDFSRLRNDVAHCSMGTKPNKEEELRAELKNSLDAYKSLVEALVCRQ